MVERVSERAAAWEGEEAAPRPRADARSFRARPDALAGAALLGLFLLVALFAPFLAPRDPNSQDLSLALRPPAFASGGWRGFPLGTDSLGRDLLSIIIHGLRVSLLVGFSAVAISFALGVSLGLWAGYRGGRAEALVMRLADIQLTLPPVLVALAVISFFGRGLGKLILLIGIINWAVYGRTVRGSVLSLREKEFVEGARAAGAPPGAVVLRHILPNVLTPTLVLSAVELPRVMLLEATLSFLGLGVPPTVHSLGSAIAKGYPVLFSGYWWVSIFPGLFLMAVVVSINLLGDWLRDALDPQLRGAA